MHTLPNQIYTVMGRSGSNDSFFTSGPGIYLRSLSHRYHTKTLLCPLSVLDRFRHLRLKQRKLRDYASEMVDLPKVNQPHHTVG